MTPTPHTKPVVGLVPLHMEVRWGVGGGREAVDFTSSHGVRKKLTALLSRRRSPHPPSSSMLSAQMLRSVCWLQSRCRIVSAHSPDDLNITGSKVNEKTP